MSQTTLCATSLSGPSFDTLIVLLGTLAEAEALVGFSTKIIDYKGSSFGELDLAWATTVHKAQGGECPVVVLILSNSHKVLLTRRLLYTGKAILLLHWYNT